MHCLVIVECEDCNQKIKHEAKLNNDRCPFWAGVCDRMRTLGWKMKVSSSGHNWETYCPDHKKKKCEDIAGSL